MEGFETVFLPGSPAVWGFIFFLSILIIFSSKLNWFCVLSCHWISVCQENHAFKLRRLEEVRDSMFSQKIREKPLTFTVRSCMLKSPAYVTSCAPPNSRGTAGQQCYVGLGYSIPLALLKDFSSS